MAKPLTVEVISRVVSSFEHCAHCQVFLNEAGVGQQIHREDVGSFPSTVRGDHDRLMTLLTTLGQRFEGRVRFRVFDPQTPEGLWKSFRHWVRRYPTFLIGGEKLVGWDEETLARRIEAHLPRGAAG